MLSLFTNRRAHANGDLPFPRAALALAEAIIPGSAKIPGADETTVALADEAVRHFHPSLLRAWRVAQATLDAAAVAQKGKPFHLLAASAQDELVRRWEKDAVLRLPLGAVSLVYRFVHFDRPHVYAAMGGRATDGDAPKQIEEPRWLQQVQRAEEWTEEEDVECDVVVIGTGAGGAVVGKELADKGLAVVFVEEGDHYRRNDFSHRSLGAPPPSATSRCPCSWGASSAARRRSTAAPAFERRHGCSSAGARI
jgi:hypothetical protein